MSRDFLPILMAAVAGVASSVSATTPPEAVAKRAVAIAKATVDEMESEIAVEPAESFEHLAPAVSAPTYVFNIAAPLGTVDPEAFGRVAAEAARCAMAAPPVGA